MVCIVLSGCMDTPLVGLSEYINLAFYAFASPS